MKQVDGMKLPPYYKGMTEHPPYFPVHRKLTSFNNKEFEVIYRYLTNDYDMITSVMIEDAYRLQHFPFKPGMTAIDLGGHIGTVSLMLASMGVHVYSVEIIPENIKIFKDNISLNGYQQFIKIYHRAIASVSNKAVKAAYQDVEDVPTGFYHHFLGHTWMGHNKNIRGKSFAIKTISLEDIFIENKIEHCHFLKTDLEGAEWDAFKDVPDDILRRIDVINGEVHYAKVGNSVNNSSLLPLFRGFFKNASMTYQKMDSSPYHAPCNAVGEHANFIYIRKGLPIPLRRF